MTKQSLFSLWIETSNLPDQEWLLDYNVRLNPKTTIVAGLVSKNGDWDFNFADQLAYRLPRTEIIFRALSPDENTQWLMVSPQSWIANAKSRLQGRNFRVMMGCEPGFTGTSLTNFLAWSVELVKEAVKQSVKISLWGLPGQSIKAFTFDPDDLFKGKFDELLRELGKSHGWAIMDYHSYTSAILAAGAYDDSYLRNVATDRELLNDVSKWYTWDMLMQEDRRWQTRHLFRHLWMNRYAVEELHCEPHYYYIGEAPHDYYGDEEDLADTWERFKNIQGYGHKTEVSGINTIGRIVEWKFGKPFAIAEVEQLIWFGEMLANDPYCLGWAAYDCTGKEGDQQRFNWLQQKQILEGMIGKNLIRFDSTETPVVPVPTVPVETPMDFNYARVKSSGLRLRAVPSDTGTYEVQFNTGVLLKVIEDLGVAASKFGKKGFWINVSFWGVRGYVAAEFVEGVNAVEKSPAWRDGLEERTRKEVSFSEVYAKNFAHGTSGHLGYMTIAKMAELLDASEKG